MLALPRQMLLTQRLASHPLADPAAELIARLGPFESDDWQGRRVAVAVGSRGIDRIAAITRALVAWMRERGAEPFVMPAMGSHGGGTPAGQREVLASYGITENAMGVPIRADIDTRTLGETSSRTPVHTSVVALEADAVVLINRVKPHTDFASASLGSGLRKMCAIGLGKVEGAYASHLAASRLGYERVIQEVAAVVAARLPRLYGVALVEDGTHHLGRVEVLRGDEFATREPALFELAWKWMPALPLPEVDVLIVDEIGKDISGAGMDTNIIGRGVDTAPMKNRRSVVRVIYARSLTPASHGNAIGIGLADIVSTRLVEQMDPDVSYTNALTAMTAATVRISVNFATDAECMRAALRLAGVTDVDARILRIRNTLSLQHIVASEACLDALSGKDEVDVVVPPTAWTLAANGNFEPANDLLSAIPAA
jgi:hypothetical protein